MDQCKQPQTCIVCKKERKDILSLLGKVVCTECEQDIVNVTVTDLPYDFYVARLKEIW